MVQFAIDFYVDIKLTCSLKLVKTIHNKTETFVRFFSCLSFVCCTPMRQKGRGEEEEKMWGKKKTRE